MSKVHRTLNHLFSPAKVKQRLSTNFLGRRLPNFTSSANPYFFPNITLKEFINYSTENQQYSIDVGSLRYFGGVCFNPIQSHFVRYLDEGESYLRKFYAIHKPKNILEKHFLFDLYFPEPNSKLPLFLRLPWTITDLKEETYMNTFLSSEEEGLNIAKYGVQHYGPVAEKKIKSEIRRLNNLLKSINRFGYKPELFEGHVRGYFLSDDVSLIQKKVFLVTGGQHRAAVLSYLGKETIPVEFEPFSPRLIRLSDSANWHSVKYKKISQEAAIKIFLSYFRNCNVKLLSGW